MIYCLFIDWYEPSLVGAFTDPDELLAYTALPDWEWVQGDLFVKTVENNLHVGRSATLEEFRRDPHAAL